MPITGTGAALAAARLAAKGTVQTKWRGIAAAQGGPLSAAQLQQMRTEVETADSSAILNWLEANLTVTTPPGGGIGVVT